MPTQEPKVEHVERALVIAERADGLYWLMRERRGESPASRLARGLFEELPPTLEAKLRASSLLVALVEAGAA